MIASLKFQTPPQTAKYQKIDLEGTVFRPFFSYFCDTSCPPLGQFLSEFPDCGYFWSVHSLFAQFSWFCASAFPAMLQGLLTQGEVPDLFSLSELYLWNGVILPVFGSFSGTFWSVYHSSQADFGTWFLSSRSQSISGLPLSVLHLQPFLLLEDLPLKFWNIA